MAMYNSKLVGMNAKWFANYEDFAKSALGNLLAGYFGMACCDGYHDMGGLDTVCHNFNKLMPRQNGHHFADDIFKCIFLNENVWIPIKISLKFVPKGPINNMPALV